MDEREKLFGRAERLVKRFEVSVERFEKAVAVIKNYPSQIIDCAHCHGLGHTAAREEPCPACKGVGKIRL